MRIDQRQTYNQATLAVGYHVWVDIHAPIKLVFDFLSREDALVRWWSTSCHSEPKPGGQVFFEWKAEKETNGQALFKVFDPPNAITWEWTYRNQEPILCDGTDHRGMRWPALCEFELATLSNQKTRVHLHDWGISGELAFGGIRQATQEGWVLAVNRLKKACELAYRSIQARKVRQQAGKGSPAMEPPSPETAEQQSSIAQP